MTDLEIELEKLLNDYHHYKFMTYGLFGYLFKSHKIDMYDFMKWLQSKKR